MKNDSKNNKLSKVRLINYTLTVLKKLEISTKKHEKKY